MMRPRWHKALSDLWSYKIRSVLVIASIAVGLFAVGMIACIHTILSQDMRGGYAAVNPANIQISVSPFTDDLVDRIKNVAGVQDVEGITTMNMRIRTGSDQWSTINLKAIPDFDEMTINRVTLEQGTWPPGKHEIVIEKNKLDEVIRDSTGKVEIELPSGKTRQLQLVGVVHDLTIGSTGGGGGFFMAPIQGYITTDTLKWLEQSDQMNVLYVTVAEEKTNEYHIQKISNQIGDEIEQNGQIVYSSLTRSSDAHPNAIYVDAISGVLFVLGLLVVFLSGFLITNTLSALLTQQNQQIGIMKTVGARSNQITGIYMVLIACFSLLALAISIPLSGRAAYALLKFLSSKINFTLGDYRIVPLSIYLQVGIALIVPQAAGIIPILHGARVKVQEAVSGFRSGDINETKGWINRQVEKIHGLSRPMLISLRNTFRRKGRLILTLVTLTLGGATFIATFNVQASLTSYVSRLGKYFLADVNLTLSQPYRVEEIQYVLATVPGVSHVEGWSAARCEVVNQDGTAGESVQLIGPPPNSSMITPIMLTGRWIAPGDENAVVLNERFQATYPELKVGDTLRLRVNGKETDWVVAGFFQLAGKSAGYLAYTDYDYLARLIHQPNKAAMFRIAADSHGLTIDQQKQFGRQIEQALKDQDIHVSDTGAGLSLLDSTTDGLNTLTTFLLIMALLTALVGSIGLMGTMSLNVMERTREIGIMRAIGASDKTIMQMVIAEGMLIGGISWLLACVVSFPISKVLSDTVSTAIFDAPSTLTTTATGFIVWLILVFILSIIASVIPARNAARLTIREVISYE